MGTFTTTAYGPPWNAMEGTGITSKGVKLKAGQQKLVVAVDPSVIPYGTKMKIWPNPFGDRNLVFTAGDTGGAFQGGKRKIDFFIASGRKAQNAWGVRNAKVTIVGHGSPKDIAILGKGTEMRGGVKAVGQPTKLAQNGVSSEQVNKLGVLQNYLQTQDPNNPLLGLVSQRLGVAPEQATTPRAAATSASSASPRTSGGPGRTRRASASAQGLSPLLELFYDPQGGWDNPSHARGGVKSIGPIGGHSDHVHVAAGPKTLQRLDARAKGFGLVVSSADRPGAVTKSGNRSFHAVGKARDYAGSPKQMSAFTKYVRKLYGL